VPEHKPSRNQKQTYSPRAWASAKAQQAWGKALELAGRRAGNPELVQEGRAHQEISGKNQPSR